MRISTSPSGARTGTRTQTRPMLTGFPDLPNYQFWHPSLVLAGWETDDIGVYPARVVSPTLVGADGRTRTSIPQWALVFKTSSIPFRTRQLGVGGSGYLC